jgi:type I restriction enzyme S subunit
LRVANVQHGRLDLNVIKYIEIPPKEAAGAVLKFGDVLMTEGGDIDKLGRGCVWRGEIQNCLHQNHIFAVRCQEDMLLPKFLVALIVSGHGRAYFQLTAKQTTNLASTNSTTLRSFPVLLPPIEEQHAILEYIDSRTAVAESLIDNARHATDLLREYRARLISDVVIGKLDVRRVDLPTTADAKVSEEYSDLLQCEEVMEDEELQEELPTEGD